MSVKSGWSRSAASCGCALNTSALRLSCPGDFRSWGTWWLLWSLLFLGDRCWHPGLSLPLVYLPLLVVVVCSELHWSVPSIVRLARLLSWVVAPACPWSERFCLLCTCHTPAWWSCRLCLALPCLLHLLPGLQGHLCGSACLFLLSSSVWFASQYCCLYLSLSRYDFTSKTFFSWELFRSQWLARYPLWPTPSYSSALFQGRLCRSARRLSWAVATLYWCLPSLPASDLQHLLIPGTYSSAVVWRQSYTLRSRSFSTSKCCRPLGLDSVFLSFSFRVAVTRWWSLPTSAPLLTWTSSSDHVHILLIIRWSIWFLSLPLGEYQVSLWTSRCKKSGPPRAKS